MILTGHPPSNTSLLRVGCGRTELAQLSVAVTMYCYTLRPGREMIAGTIA